MIESTLTLAVADDDLICESQSPGAASDLTLAGGSLDVPRHIVITSAGDDSGRTFTVVGTDRYNNSLSEAVTGENAGAATTKANFATVTKVSVDAATAAAVKVGTGGTAEGPWLPLDPRRSVFNVGVGSILVGDSAALTYGLEGTYSDVQAEGFREAAGNPVSLYDSKTAAFTHNHTTPICAMRLAITAHTAGGVKAAILQAGR